MEHPIPQNVTSFEFHLVGDMTLRQFAYLAAGLGIAYLTFVLAFQALPILAVPIIAVSSLSGAAFAFMPIADRPLDHWVKAFLKSVYSPTQALWQMPGSKKGVINLQDAQVKNRLQTYLSSLGNVSPSPIFNIPPIKNSPLAVPPQPPKIIPVVPINPQPPQAPQNTQTPVATDKSSLPSSEELNKIVTMAEQAQVLQGKINQTEREIQQLKIAASNPQPNLNSQQIQQAVGNLQNLMEQTEDLYHQTTQINKNPELNKKPQVVVVETPKQVKTQLTLTSMPNVINGIVTDALDNYLDGVIVIIHDKDKMPVRALKTNKLGQFAGATPLPDGVYTITLEKDNLEFETLQVTLGGEILAPILIHAKKGGLV